MANPTDQQYAIVAETVAGTTPATPAFLLYPNRLGNSLELKNDDLVSSNMMPNRENAGTSKTNYRVEGSLKTHLMRDASIELLIASALSGAWATNVLKAGVIDPSFTIEKTFKEGATTYYRQFKGCQSTKFSVSCEAAGNADATFDIVGMSTAQAAIPITGATYAASSSTKRLTGLDVSAVTIAGLTATYAKLEFATEMPREAQQTFGTNAAAAIGANGAHKHTLSLTLYRRDWTPETLLLNDTPVAVSFTIGGVGNGYTFTLPAATCSAPSDEEDGSKLFAKLDFTAGWDATQQTGLVVTRL